MAILVALVSALTLNVPFVPQQEDTCAAAALAMVMRFWDVPVAQEEIVAALLQPEIHGILGSRLAAFARERGFTAIAYEGDVAQLRDFVGRGRPLIVAWKLTRDRYHNVIVVGFDDERAEIVVNDPAEGAARRVRIKDFEKRWAKAGHWTLLVLPSPK
jgi:ABC-type bacteriocin/lantibiotic exporter with double-glycine peptidase domain